MDLTPGVISHFTGIPNLQEQGVTVATKHYFLEKRVEVTSWCASLGTNEQHLSVMYNMQLSDAHLTAIKKM